MRPALRQILFGNRSLQSGLIAYWKLEDLTDSVGGLTLTNNAAATFVAARVNNGAQLTAASSQFFTRSDGGRLSIGSNAITFAGWAYFDSLAANRSILGKRTGTNEYLLDVLATGAAHFGVWFGAVQKQAQTSAGVVTAGAWHFIVADFDPVSQTVGVRVNNGARVSAATGSSASDTGGTNFNLGANGANTVFMDGRLDEWGRWNRLLTAAEQSQLYAGVTYPAFA